MLHHEEVSTARYRSHLRCSATLPAPSGGKWTKGTSSCRLAAKHKRITALWGDCAVRNEFTAIIEKEAAWYIAYCLEIPGANGQGRTPDEARESLVEAIALILTDRREDGLRGVPPEAICETVIVV